MVCLGWVGTALRGVIAVTPLVFAGYSPAALASTPGAPSPATPRATVRLSVPEALAPSVREALTFELDQAGYAVVTSDEVTATVAVWLDASGWHIEVEQRGRQVRLTATEPSDAAPATIALDTVELLLAASLTPAPPPPDGEPARSPAPPVSRTFSPRLDAPPSVYARAPAPRATRSRWALDLGVAGASFGPLGIALGLVRRWERADVGATVEGGYLRGASEEASNVATSTVRGAGFLRARTAAAYVFRPGARVRPSVGVTSEWIFAFITSGYTGPDPSLAGGTMQRDGLRTGVMWIPGPELGLRIGARPRLDVFASTRGGPQLTLRQATVADGTTMSSARWFVAGTVGLSLSLGQR